MGHLEPEKLKEALKRNINWFKSSGIMLPSDGIWGVAERIAVSGGNTAIDKIREAFPAVTEHDGWCVVEQRRADCNFQAAYLFLLCGKVLNDEECTLIGENLTHFLYARSGLLTKKTSASGKLLRGTWQWSHIVHTPKVYFDDEAWCLFLQLEISRMRPDIGARYEMPYWADVLAEELWRACDRVLRVRWLGEDGHLWDTESWNGAFDLPHWGGLACMALARACYGNDDQEKIAKYTNVIKGYLDLVSEKASSMICSEQAYLILACMAAWRYIRDDKAYELALELGKGLISRLDEHGNLAAQHYEAPVGSHLVDLIYTLNWAALGFQSLAGENEAFASAKDKVHSLIVSIQDTSPEAQFSGCWRGMYDLNSNSWGGGDCYEGGAGSIYSGWTNAPISIALALDLMERDLFTIES